MAYSGDTRFKHRTDTGYAGFRDAAVAYVGKLTRHEQRGLREKPLDWNPGHGTYFTAMFQLLTALQKMQLPIKGRIIEVGGGSGWATEIMAALGYRITCVEPSADMLAVAKSRVESHLRHHGRPRFGRYMNYICSTIEDCDLPRGRADAVMFFESFHHVVDEHLAVSRALSALRPGGWLVILGDANWRPGNVEQETAWAEEMDRYGTLESPFTSDYLEWLLADKGFVEVTRHHMVCSLTPVDEGEQTLRSHALIDAHWVNLVTARRPGGDVPATPPAAAPVQTAAAAAVAPEPVPSSDGPSVDAPPPTRGLRSRLAAALRRLAAGLDA